MSWPTVLSERMKNDSEVTGDLAIFVTQVAGPAQRGLGFGRHRQYRSPRHGWVAEWFKAPVLKGDESRLGPSMRKWQGQHEHERPGPANVLVCDRIYPFFHSIESVYNHRGRYRLIDLER
jgi:hypothetical protein